MKTQFSTTRRNVLRGIGATVALPWLESLAAAGTEQPACRIATICTPIGVNVDTWTPTAEGAGFALPETLSELADYRKDFSVLSGLCHPRSWGGHSVEGASFLTGADILSGTPGFNWKNSISMDQLIAEHIGHQTRFPSLELMKSGSGTKGHSLSWSREGVAQAGESDPAAVFDRLFIEGNAEDKEQAAAWFQKRKSILDLVRGDFQRLEKSVSRDDRERLDQYATSLREVESRVKRSEEWSKKPKPAINFKKPEAIRDGGVKERGAHMRAMMDLMVLAFQTQSTRVATYSICDSGSPIPESGVNEGHHGLSHHGGDEEKKKKLTKIDQFHVRQLAYFFEKLKATPDGAGNLLDNSMVLYGSGLGDGSRHSNKDLPILLAGHAGGKLKQGIHHRYPSNVTPLSNLFVDLLQRMDVGVEKFSDSSGSLL